jgi:two-component system OmpR family response regulator
MNQSAQILVVDDDLEIRTLLQTYLEKNGLQVSTAADGQQMQQVLDKGKIDLIVLDLMLPGDDGLTLCRNLRVKSDIPVIMLTARGDEMDRILGLEMGADDYLPKPFNPRELLARIKVILRRTQAGQTQEVDTEHPRLLFSGWTLDTISRHLTSPDGVVSPLSHSEFRLLKVFLTHPNRPLSRDRLLDLTQGREAEPFDRSIDVLVGRLRRRLGDDAKAPALIKTLRGEGYLLASKVTGSR